MRGVAAMVNLIGIVPDPAAILAIPGARCISTARLRSPAARSGHVTVVGESHEALAPGVERVEELAQS